MCPIVGRLVLRQAFLLDLLSWSLEEGEGTDDLLVVCFMFHGARGHHLRLYHLYGMPLLR